MNTAQQIAERIQLLAKEKNISMNKMLKDCALSNKVIDNMKAGSMPSADKLAIIAKYHEVSVEHLMGIADIPTPPTKKDYDKINMEKALNIFLREKLGREPTKEDIELADKIFDTFAQGFKIGREK